ncbi:Uma2 family endonuclease [Telluribacter sp.]|jgi:Uma2 family endonuclease|uniref:Uma2 family endonuclease n=1 Tax=Telluribacter sp. TaxID=1978767 RepID=UPI002E10300A|nr:Uma2 family endonuclease [Telluribacter sp.]
MDNVFKIKTVEGLTDDLFFDLCQANSELRMERDQHGNIIVMSPTGTDTGHFNLGISAKIWFWNDRSKLGFAFDSSTGFTLPNSAVRSPDASWVSKSRWESLSKSAQERFAPICPDFVVEVRSRTDRLPDLQSKMEEYRENGCRLGWLIDRQDKTVHIYRAAGSVEIVTGESVTLSGEEVLPGLVMEVRW